jgi:hypothetical protein
MYKFYLKSHAILHNKHNAKTGLMDAIDTNDYLGALSEINTSQNKAKLRQSLCESR